MTLYKSELQRASHVGEINKKMTNRIEYIDLAKGICIVLVVFTHVAEYLGVKYALADFLRIFRMPLYFFLSGLFFKQYEGFMSFLKRKVNKLLIPFTFFYLTTAILLPFCLSRVGISFKNSDLMGIQIIWAFITPERFMNMPIWFLLCLFNINILFYLLYVVSNKVYKNGQTLMLAIGSGISGVVGYTLGGVNLPMFMDSTLTALPFFFVGFVCNRKTDLLRKDIPRSFLLVLSLLCFSSCFLACGPVSYSGNLFYDTTIWQVYFCGITGTLGVIFIAKAINHLPLFSYCGRYSIILLTTHIIIVQMLMVITNHLGINGWIGVNTIMLITLLSYYIIIPFMLRFFPYIVAQKDLIKIK